MELYNASAAAVKSVDPLYRVGGTRVLHPLRFFKLEDTAVIIIELVSALMTSSSILSSDSFYADMHIFNEMPR